MKYHCGGGCSISASITHGSSQNKMAPQAVKFLSSLLAFFTSSLSLLAIQTNLLLLLKKRREAQKRLLDVLIDGSNITKSSRRRSLAIYKKRLVSS